MCERPAVRCRIHDWPHRWTRAGRTPGPRGPTKERSRKALRFTYPKQPLRTLGLWRNRPATPVAGRLPGRRIGRILKQRAANEHTGGRPELGESDERVESETYRTEGSRRAIACCGNGRLGIGSGGSQGAACSGSHVPPWPPVQRGGDGSQQKRLRARWANRVRP